MKDVGDDKAAVPRPAPPVPGQEQPPAASDEAPAPDQQQNSAVDNFANLIGLKGKLEYKADYAIKVDSEETGMMVSDATHYVKGEKMRMDSTYEGMSTRTYYLPEGLYSCTEVGGSFMCYSFPKQENAASAALDDIRANPKTYSPVADGTRSIAGATASCYRIDDANGYQVRYCFSPEGVPLYIKTSGTSGGKEMETETEAKSYSTSVADSVFVLPAEPQSLGLPG
jgi:hypothetical protein